MTPLTEKLAEIRGRLESATPGPWKADLGNLQIEQAKTRDGICVFDRSSRDSSNGKTNPVDPYDDAEFIAEAPSDIAFLLATVERMTAALQFYATTSEVNDITLRFGWRARAALGESE